MGIYFKDDKKKERWDLGQAILHREFRETQKPQRDERQPGFELFKNSYGRLSYLEKGQDSRQEKEGFALEAFEAPGTPAHTEKEKHLERSSMKKVNNGDRKKLYASEVPFHNQAFFYEMSGAKKSGAFLKCMKMLVHRQGHQTIQDAFGFLDQEAEQRELEALKENRNELFSDESGRVNKKMDALTSRLQRKEAKERQLCNELQVMLDARVREEAGNGKAWQRHGDLENQKDGKESLKDDSFLQRRMQTEGILEESSEEASGPDEPADGSEDE